MHQSLLPSEQFLVNFHDTRPGITSTAYGALVARRGGLRFRSSYESLIAEIEDADHAVLDIGCGDGFLLSLLKNRAPTQFSLSGIDLSAGEIAAAHLRLNGAARLYCGRAQSLPMADNSVDAYVSRLLALRSSDGSRFIRFGDARLRDADGIRQALAPWFTDISIQEIALSRRYAPGELWEWFEGMYDLQFITAGEQAQFKSGYLAEIKTLCDSDGRLEFTDTLRQVHAVAA